MQLFTGWFLHGDSLNPRCFWQNKYTCFLLLGTFSGLELCFFFERRPGYFFMALFFPASHIVAISWISLWLSNESTLSDIIQIILAMIFLNFTQNAVMPKVSYIKALDVFMGTCFFLVFLALLKLSVYKFLHRRSLTVVHSEFEDKNPNETDRLDVNGLSHSPYVKRKRSSEESNLWLVILQTINKRSFGVLIVIFLGFCFVYFAVYSYLSVYSPRVQCHFDWVKLSRALFYYLTKCQHILGLKLFLCILRCIAAIIMFWLF